MRKWQVLVLLIGVSFLSDDLVGMKKRNKSKKSINKDFFDLSYDDQYEVLEFIDNKSIYDFMLSSKKPYESVKHYLSTYKSKWRVVKINYGKSNKEYLDRCIKNNLGFRLRLIYHKGGFLSIPASDKLIEIDFSELGNGVSLGDMEWSRFPNLECVNIGRCKISKKTMNSLGESCKKLKCLRICDSECYKWEDQDRSVGLYKYGELDWELVDWGKFKNLEELEIKFPSEQMKKAGQNGLPAIVISKIADSCPGLKKLKIFANCKGSGCCTFDGVDWSKLKMLDDLCLEFNTIIGSEMINNIARSCKKLRTFHMKRACWDWFCDLSEIRRFELKDVDWRLFLNLSRLYLISNNLDGNLMNKIGDALGGKLRVLTIGRPESFFERKGFLNNVKFEKFSQLTELNIIFSCITKKNIEAIASSCRFLEDFSLVGVKDGLGGWCGIDWSKFSKLRRITACNLDISMRFPILILDGLNTIIVAQSYFSFVRSNGYLKNVTIISDDRILKVKDAMELD